MDLINAKLGLSTVINLLTDLRHKASWGCVKAISKEGCVELVTKNAADIVQLNATEMFLAGKDHNLAPFMGFNNKG